MRKITPYTAAAILILSRLYSYALYIPGEKANAGMTVLASLLMNVVKAALLLPLAALYCKKHKDDKCCSPAKSEAAVISVAAFAGLLSAGTAFSSLTAGVYPDRLSSVGVPVIWFGVCAYTASLGLQGVSRSAGFMVFAFTGVILLTFIGMRHSMLTSRVYIYSPDITKELKEISGLLCRTMYDIPLLLGVLPYIDGKKSKSIGIYILFDAVMTAIVFFMYSAVLGDFRSKAGYSVFTLFSCTAGTLIDRSDGIFIAITCSCGIITCAVLMLILADAVKAFAAKADTVRSIGITAGILTVMMVMLKDKAEMISIFFAFSAVISLLLFSAIDTLGTVKTTERTAA